MQLVDADVARVTRDADLERVEGVCHAPALPQPGGINGLGRDPSIAADFRREPLDPQIDEARDLSGVPACLAANRPHYISRGRTAVRRIPATPRTPPVRRGVPPDLVAEGSRVLPSGPFPADPDRCAALGALAHCFAGLATEHPPSLPPMSNAMTSDA